MTDLYSQLHQIFNSRKRFYFPFDCDLEQIQLNGIYILFEKGEKHKQWDRIVRVGTHTGHNQLISRLLQHFVKENKNRSIFRKNIGRAILNKNRDPYLTIWELDTTSRAEKIKNGHLIDKFIEKELEKQISKYIQDNLSFTIFEVPDKEKRLFWESRIISTLANGPDINISANWLGRFSPKDKICEYGLWQVNELFNKPLDLTEFNELSRLIFNNTST
jgi:hypothetical protein